MVVVQAWCEADAAVAHHDRGDAVRRRRDEPMVPGGLAVVVRVDVDEAGRDGQAAGVDLLAPAPGHAADGRDAVAAHRHVGFARIAAAAVDDGSEGVHRHRRLRHRAAAACRRDHASRAVKSPPKRRCSSVS
jgi:hypothetical protein